MKSILRTLAFFAMAMSLVLPLSLHAADKVALSEGTIKKIDPVGQRIMLAHGPIEHLFMPPMTMMFKVKDAALLKKVKEGDKVLFRVEQDNNGDYVVVSIKAAKK
ncbi:MAG: copper-binding protein [Rhodocyclaceae bacterium]|nr:copper-binding protein [Rhodocyclaceae bacterium]MDP1956960.1 copper-binding protein [Rhodocyclaceae bacterium]